MNYEYIIIYIYSNNSNNGNSSNDNKHDDHNSNNIYIYIYTPNCPSRGEIPKILKLAWGKAFVEVVAMRRLACV